jgi:hypothetical protein
MDSKNVSASVKDQISAKNESRKSFIRSLYNDIDIRGGKVLVPELGLSLLQKIAVRPTDEGFSDRDFNFFKGLYSQFKAGNINKQQEEIFLQHEVATYIQKQMQTEGRINPLLKNERDEHSRKASNFGYFAAKCAALISVIDTEIARRANAAKAQQEKDKAEYAEFIRVQQATKEAAAAEVRAKEQAKRAAAAARPKLAGIVLGTGLEALALIAVELRKSGKFTSDRKITKTEAIALIGDADALKAAFAIAKQNASEVLATLADYRQITAKKSGAVTVYGIRE